MGNTIFHQWDRSVDWRERGWRFVGQPIEFIAGTDPTNAGSYFQVEHTAVDTNGYVVIEWNSISNRLYQVGWANALGNGFQTLEDNIAYPVNSYTDQIHCAERRGFYRVGVRLD